jgi:hypothetical protein
VLKHFGRKAKNWSENLSNLSEYEEIDKIRRNGMIKQTDLAGTFLLPGTSMTVNRMGFGAMQLAGPEVWGTQFLPTARKDEKGAPLRNAEERGGHRYRSPSG